MLNIIQYGKTISSVLADIEYDGQLSIIAYIILIVMFSGIIVGLTWCFYRAIKHEETSPEPQKHDEIGS